MIKEIVIPLDGSAEAEITIPYGMALTQKMGAQMDFVCVDESGAADTANLYRSYLQHLDERLKAKHPGRLAWQTRLQTGKAADEILRFIEEHVADLVILSAHGASGKGAVLVGKVANKILTATTKPVLMIKSPAPEKGPCSSAEPVSTSARSSKDLNWWMSLPTTRCAQNSRTCPCLNWSNNWKSPTRTPPTASIRATGDG